MIESSSLFWVQQCYLLDAIKNYYFNCVETLNSFMRQFSAEYAMCFRYKLYLDARFTVFCVNMDKIPFAIRKLFVTTKCKKSVHEIAPSTHDLLLMSGTCTCAKAQHHETNLHPIGLRFP